MPYSTLIKIPSPCPFCPCALGRVLEENDHTVIYSDGFPISLGHTLIIPKRHIASLFDASEEEQNALFKALYRAKTILDALHQPNGYNIGINDGVAAGQTVLHLHIHLIPRYSGDSVDPRGGVRWVLPETAKYWE